MPVSFPFICLQHLFQKNTYGTSAESVLSNKIRQSKPFPFCLSSLFICVHSACPILFRLFFSPSTAFSVLSLFSLLSPRPATYEKGYTQAHSLIVEGPSHHFHLYLNSFPPLPFLCQLSSKTSRCCFIGQIYFCISSLCFSPSIHSFPHYYGDSDFFL